MQISFNHVNLRLGSIGLLQMKKTTKTELALTQTNKDIPGMMQHSPNEFQQCTLYQRHRIKIYFGGLQQKYQIF